MEDENKDINEADKNKDKEIEEDEAKIDEEEIKDINEIKKEETKIEIKEGTQIEENSPDLKQDLKQKNKKKKDWKKIMIVVGAVLIVLVVILFFVGQQHHESEFEYKNLSFERVPFGNGYVYTIQLVITRNGSPFDYTFKFTKDPRTFGDIPANISALSKKAYFSFPKNATNCTGDILIAAFQLGQFLSALNINVTPAVTENFSNNSLPVKNCSNALSNSVIILKPFSNQNRIYQDEENKNCVILETKDCKVTEISERYILAILEKYQKQNKFQDLLENFSNYSK
jgi:hypothetical protein